MNIICDKQTLTEAVSNVSRAVSAKNPITALEGILMKASGNKLTLTGYDLDMAVSTTIEADIQKEGDIVLSAKIFLDMIRRMPCERITISSDEKLLTLIKGSRTEYTILGIPSQEFPELPGIVQASAIILDKSVLKNMIDQTLFAVSTSDAKPAHMGARFDIRDGNFNIVAVDGFRLALRHETLKDEEEHHFTVPSKSLQEISKLIRDEEGTVELQVAKRHILFQIGNYQMISRLLEGEFLDYNAAIPHEGRTEVRISTKELINSIERTSLLISDAVKSPLKMRFAEGVIEMSCSTSLGKAYDEIQATIQGDEVEIGFNSRYLIEALKASDCDEIKLILSGPFSPVKLVPLEGDGFTFLVLPVRLKVE